MKKVVGNHWTQIADLLPGRSGSSYLIFPARFIFLKLLFVYNIIIAQDNAVKNRFRSIEKNPVKERRSCFRIKPKIIDTADDKELIERFGYSHDEHEHCHYDWQNNNSSVTSMVAAMDLHQHCDHEVEQTSKNDFSVDCEENNSTSADINKAEAKIGWFEDGWVDDIIQIAQLDIPNEEKACDATNMVTPFSRNPITPTFTVDNLLHSMFSRINVNYPTLDINNMSIGSNKPIPRFRTVSLQ